MKWLQKLIFRFIRPGADSVESSRIVEGTLHSLFIQGISIVMVLLGNLLITRWAGADEYGKYVHIFNWISIVSIIALGGQEDIVVAQIPKYHAHGRRARIYSLVRGTNGFILVASLVLGSAFLLAVYYLPLKTLHEYRNEFLYASAAIYFMAFLSLNQSILQSLNYIRLAQLVEKWIKPFLLIVFVIAVRAMSIKFVSRTLIGITITVTGICCIILVWILMAKTKQYRSPAEQGGQKEDLRLKSFHFLSIDLLNLLSTKITMLVLPYFSLQKEVGIFNISYRFADLVIYPFFLMNAVMPQLFARHHDSGAAHKQSLYNDSTRLMLLISVPLLLINILGGKFFLGWFGNDFREGYTGLVYLSCAQFLFSFFGPAHIILTMQDKEKYAVMALVVYVAALLITNLLLVPVMGMNGGMISVLISSLIYNLVLGIMAYRLCGVVSPALLFVRRRIFRS
jgi:O-antigen/teichoic acid export membrane protein